MAKFFGIPKHTVDIPLGDLSQEEFLVIALECVQALGWQLTFVSRSGFRADTGSSAVSSNEEIFLLLNGNNTSLVSESKGKQLYDSKQNKENTDTFYSLFFRVKEQADRTALRYRYIEWQSRFGRDEDLIRPNETRQKPGFDFWRVFIPVQGYFVTPILIDLNILILLLMFSTGANILWPDSQTVITWGGNFRPMTLEGEWWRLITSNFLHFGIIHLFFNMGALTYIGAILEPRLGRLKFLLAYLLTGITSGIASLWWHDNAVSAGASGAIFGMFGVFLALLTTNFVEKETRNTTLRGIGYFVVYNLIFGAAIGADNAGHIGGLIGGLFMGYCFYLTFIRPKLTAALLALSTLFLLGVAVVVYKNIPNPTGAYFATLDRFSANEEKALRIYEGGKIPNSVADVKKP